MTHLGDITKHSKQWIYPGAMHRHLKISITDVYEVLELCVEEGLIDQYLEIYCPSCQHFTGNIYKTIMEVPEELGCPHCDNEILDPSKHAVIIYRVNHPPTKVSGLAEK